MGPGQRAQNTPQPIVACPVLHLLDSKAWQRVRAPSQGAHKPDIAVYPKTSRPTVSLPPRAIFMRPARAALEHMQKSLLETPRNLFPSFRNILCKQVPACTLQLQPTLRTTHCPPLSILPFVFPLLFAVNVVSELIDFPSLAWNSRSAVHCGFQANGYARLQPARRSIANPGTARLR
jgi:hypothetical protein